MKPFYETTEMIDVDLYADALVAIYRFSHSTAIDTVFPACIVPERSDAVKTCVMKACLTIATEVNQYPHDGPCSGLLTLQTIHRVERLGGNRLSPPYFPSSQLAQDRSFG